MKLKGLPPLKFLAQAKGRGVVAALVTITPFQTTVAWLREIHVIGESRKKYDRQGYCAVPICFEPMPADVVKRSDRPDQKLTRSGLRLKDGAYRTQLLGETARRSPELC